MNKEDKELLMKDLCARLPYGVKCYGYCFKIDDNHCECYGTLDSIKLGVWYPFHLSNRISINNGATYEETFSDVKPYLLPLSSMTEEQNEEFSNQLIELELKAISDEIEHTKVVEFEVDFYNKHHLDWRGLIPLGLAIDATGLNIY